MEISAIFNPENMKISLVILVCFFCISLSVNAQNLNRKSIAFLDWFFNQNKGIQLKKGRNFYLSGFSKYQIEGLEKLFSKDTLHHMRQSRTDTPRFICLSKKDKTYIRHQIKKLGVQQLPKEILPQLQYLAPDTIKALPQRYLFWESAYKKGIHGFYAFNTPIFFDNGKLCLFVYDYSCGNLCGYGTISIYKKTKVGWVQYVELSNWIS